MFRPNSTLVVCLLILLGIGCQQSGNDPTKTLNAFSQALKNNDIATARKLATPESDKTITLIEQGMKSQTQNPIWLPILAEEYTSDQVRIQDDVATVTLHHAEKKEDFEVELKKIGDEWKVDFELNTLFRLMLKKLNKKGAEKAISLDQTLTELQHINLKQVEKDLDNSKQKVDSVKKSFYLQPKK